MKGDYVGDVESIRAAQEGDEAALERILLSNLGLVKSIAARFVGRGAEWEDLVQIGSVGLVKAIRGWQEDKNCRLTTYAVPLIVGEIKRYLRDDGPIKIARELKRDAVTVKNFCEAYEKEYGTSAKTTDICRETGLSEERVALALEAARPLLRFGEEEGEVSPEKVGTVDSIGDRVDAIALSQAMETLSPEEKTIIRLRYEKNLTQEKTARLIGLTQVKVSREEKRILKKLREAFFSGEKVG